MKIFTFYSDSHKHLLDLFLKSFFKNCNLDLIVKKIDQKCSGDYHSNGWKEAMISKIQYIIDSLNQCNEGEIMVHSDSKQSIIRIQKLLHCHATQTFICNFVATWPDKSSFTLLTMDSWVGTTHRLMHSLNPGKYSWIFISPNPLPYYIGMVII